MRRLALILAVASTTAFAQLPKDVTILHEDARSLTVQFVPQFATQTLKTTGGQELKRVSFEGEIDERGRAGAPWITYRGISLQFPTARVSVTVVATESQVREGVSLLAVPKMVPDKKFGWSPVYQAARIPNVPKRSPAEVYDLAPSLGKFIGTLRLYPVEYNQDGNGARLFTKIVVRIDFDAWSVPTVKASEPNVGDPQRFVPGNAPASRQKAAFDSPLAQGGYKMQVSQTGMYKIDESFLQKANISLSSIGNINSIRIFGNGGRMLPEDLTQPRPNGLEELARYVVDVNGNGAFDPEDYVLFYGVSTRGWDYDPTTKRYSHYFSYYSEPNYYFLTFGGANGIPMDSVVSTDIAGAYTPTDFQEKLFLKQDRFNLIASGRQWVGQEFDYFNPSVVYTNSLSGYVASAPVQYRFVFWTRSNTYDGFTVYESGQPLGASIPTGTVDVDPSDNEYPYASVTPEASFVGSGMITDNRSNVKIVFNTTNQSAKGWIYYMDLLYRRSFDAVGNSLLFDSPDTTAVVEYVVHSLPTTDVLVFDVTDHQSVKRITAVRTDIADGTVRRFQVAQTAGSIKKFAVVGLNATLTPASIAHVEGTNLHGFSPGANFVIVSPTAFENQAERLSAYRQANDAALKPIVVSIDNIYNEFSGGLLDPMATRDFLRYAESNWSIPPKYVLLFGGGHYDYKNILSSTPNWIPPYESLESIYQINSFASDDFFVMLDAGSPRISIPIGRVPARSAEEATSMVDKIIEYETNSPFDTWRNRITFVADDGLTSSGDDGDIHTAQAEDLAQNHTPDSFEKDKIYESMYPTVLSATGRTKPQVNKDIVSAFNRGTLIVNYSGHGNSQQWAHEAVFTQAADLPQLVNLNRLTFLVAATCNFAAYDDPTEESAGEQILVMDKGGAVAEVTSSRAVFQYQNQEFNNELYDNLFPRDSLGNPRRLGDAMWMTKQSFYGTNDIKFHLLADPTMRLDVPRSLVSLDSVNGKSTAQLDTMRALGTVTVNGIIRNPDGTPWPTFNGTGVLEVFDSQRQVFLQDINYNVEVIGSVLYRGEVSINNGSYRAIFPIPKDVTYGNQSRLSLYAWNNTTDAVGYTENVTINGTDSTAAADTSGPQISIYFDNQSFRPGDRVKPDATLFVDLQSRNGINTSTVGIGHGLQGILNNTTTIDLTNYYRGDLDTYQSGKVQYPMSDLADGKYTLLVKAWDIRNNSSQSQTYFVVSSSTDLEMANVVNYPNPFSHSTTFTFQRNSEDPIDIEIKIYTIAGRLIQDINSYSVIDRFVEIPWDGRDRDGDPLANGVYLYKISAKTADRRTTKEEFGKLVIMR